MSQSSSDEIGPDEVVGQRVTQISCSPYDVQVVLENGVVIEMTAKAQLLLSRESGSDA